MAAIDRELSRVNYHQARAAQERAAAARAKDERSRQVHLYLAIVYEVRSLFGMSDVGHEDTGSRAPDLR